MNHPSTPATIKLEFRDRSTHPFEGGPSLTIQPNGAITSGNKGLPRIPPGEWQRLEIEFESGPDNPKTYTLRIGKPGKPLTTLAPLPFASKAFTHCTWFGFSSLGNEKTAFYLDDLRLNVGK
jgi:hypothetical protein